MQPIIVTGAGKGLGKSIAAKLIGDGYPIIAVDRNDTLLAALKTEYPGMIETHALDVSAYDEVERLFQVMKNRSFTGLVNNAGIYKGKNIVNYLFEDVEQVVNVNLKGAIYFSRFFGELMTRTKQEGVIVNLSSSSVYGGGDPVYSSTKAGLIGLTKSCAKVFSPYLRVNAVAPGIVNTDILNQVPDEIVKWYRATELVKRPLEPVDVANTVSFLFSEGGRNYSGAVFDLNNGFHM